MQLLQDPCQVTKLLCITLQQLVLRIFVIYLQIKIIFKIQVLLTITRKFIVNHLTAEKKRDNLHLRACSASSFITAFSITGDEHSCSNSASGTPCLMASSFKCFGFGTTKATVNCFDGSPQTHIFSTIAQVFNSASTLPSDTYSPACNFTKSFFRSVAQKVVHKSIEI